MKIRRFSVYSVLALLFSSGIAVAREGGTKAHGIAMHGDLGYDADFAHFDYVQPKAPRGGSVRLAAVGTSFDSFNPFIVKGVAAVGIGAIYDTLLESSADEPFSEYGLLAASVETPADRSWVRFRLREEAVWHDGKPITADDVVWTFETLVSKGHPFYRAYYGHVDRVLREDSRTVRFNFKPGENRELPLILGQMPVLPKHYWKDRSFDATTLEPPLGSGPYRIDGFEAGRTVRYERVPDYWGRALPVSVGRYNFDEIQYDYYRDTTVAIEAFKAGEYDYREENSSKHWATSYGVPAVAAGLLIKVQIHHNRSSGMQGFVYNTRRSLFRDARIRRALGYAFDFEWSNRNLFYGQYVRTKSYFDNSPLAASGLPEGAELALLEPYRDRLPEEVFEEAYAPPETDGSGKIRSNLRKAVRLLAEAGWAIDKASRKLRHRETGKAFTFEILLVDPLVERYVLPFTKNLERLGIDASVRTVDTAQYRRRLDEFDFDMVVASFAQSLSPGNEQRDYWGSTFADQPGSRNLIGVKDPVIDALIELVIAAPDRPTLLTRVRALDRVLLWNHFVIPQFHIPYDRILYWDKFGRPKENPLQGVQFDTWWVDPDKAETLKGRRTRLGKP